MAAKRKAIQIHPVDLSAVAEIRRVSRRLEEPVEVPVAASAVAIHSSIKDKIKSSVFSILSNIIANVPVRASAVAVAVAAPVVPIIPVVKIGIINRASDARKLVGTEEQLIISSPLDREGIFSFADKMVNIIITETPYNLRRGPSSLSLSLCQMMIAMKTLYVDAFYESDTVKKLIRSTNLLPNLESLTMRQPRHNIVNRTRFLGTGWVTLKASCLDDDENIVKTNPKLRSITIDPGVWAPDSELKILKWFVKTNPSIERMDVICLSDYEFRTNQTRTDSPERTAMKLHSKRIVTSAVNALKMNRALAIKNRVFAIKKIALEVGAVPSCFSPILERACSIEYRYINVFDRETDDLLYEHEPPIDIKQAGPDSLTPLFGLVKFMLCARPSLCPRRYVKAPVDIEAPVIIEDPVVIDDPVVIEDPVAVVIANAVELNNPDLLLYQQENINPIRNSLN